MRAERRRRRRRIMENTIQAAAEDRGLHYSTDRLGSVATTRCRVDRYANMKELNFS
jgi:hypothetical protein